MLPWVLPLGERKEERGVGTGVFLQGVMDETGTSLLSLFALNLPADNSYCLPPQLFGQLSLSVPRLRARFQGL